MSVTTMEKVHALLTEWGFTVDTRKGWETRKASSVAFKPEYIVEHHTGGNSTPDSLLANGRVGLKGPLCHWTIDRDGTIRAIAAGYANHAGYNNQAAVNTLINNPPLDRDVQPGPDTKNYSSNRRAWGIEVKATGTFTEAQHTSATALEAAICIVQKWDKPRVGGHREITRRKPDPVHVMWQRRVAVAELIKKSPQPAPKPAIPVTIRRGSRGEAVGRWQSILQQLGYKQDIWNRKLVSVDKVFGPGTERATKRFQKAYGLVQDGICGKATWTKALGL